MKPYRVIHFVSGGGSGATGMAVSLAVGNQRGVSFEPQVVFRRKNAKNPTFEQILKAENIPFHEVVAAPKIITVGQLCAILRKFQPHVFVAHGFSEHLWGRLAAWITNVPIILQVEHNDERYTWPRLWLSKRLLKVTHRVVCVSEGVKKSLQKRGLAQAQTPVIPNGIPVQDFQGKSDLAYTQRANHIVMIARFSRQKDHATLIRAVQTLKKDYPVQLLLIGGGQERYKKQQIRLCEKLHLTETVQFLGQKTRTETSEILRANKIFVLATHREGLPLALMEAMAAGCVVIGSDVAGVSELIEPGKTGFCVPPCDPDALAQTLKAVFDHPEQAARVAAAGRDYAFCNFNMEKMVARYEQLFLEALKMETGPLLPEDKIVIR